MPGKRTLTEVKSHWIRRRSRVVWRLTGQRSFTMRNWINQFTSIMLLLAVSCISALAQYTGMPGTGTTSGPYTAPKGGYGSGAAIGIGLGAAAGAGVAYWALQDRKSTRLDSSHRCNS